MFQLSCLILVSVTIAAVAITKAEYSDREIEMKICDPETTPEMRGNASQCLKEHFTPKLVKMIQECASNAAPDTDNYQDATTALCKSITARRRMSMCVRGRGLSFIREITLVKIEEMMSNYKICAANALGMKSQTVVTYVSPEDAPVDDISE